MTNKQSIGLMLLSVLLLVVCVLALGIGAVSISPAETMTGLLQKTGLTTSSLDDPVKQTVLWSIRLPRIVLGLLVGSAIAAAGASLQGLFRNPLAEPSLIGVSGGAALAAACTIVLKDELAWLLGFFGSYAVPLAAFLGGLVVTLLVYRLASSAGRTQVTMMLLAGVAVQALTVSGIGFLQYAADDNELRDLVFWTLGSLGGTNWEEIALISPLLIAVLLTMPLLSRALNALLLGEAEANHLGFESERVKIYVIVLSSVAVGVSVAAAGILAFVGLIVPHLVRLMFGPDHRLVLPGSMILGATLMIAADTLARTIVTPAELPIGILFALLGGPFFLYLLRKSQGESLA